MGKQFDVIIVGAGAAGAILATRLTEDAHRSVLDAQGNVYGLEGLTVADASVMPDCIRANTNITSMVIGERIADFLR